MFNRNFFSRGQLEDLELKLSDLLNRMDVLRMVADEKPALRDKIERILGALNEALFDLQCEITWTQLETPTRYLLTEEIEPDGALRTAMNDQSQRAWADEGNLVRVDDERFLMRAGNTLYDLQFDGADWILSELLMPSMDVFDTLEAAKTSLMRTAGD
jgi:hypothetical protein